MENAVRGLALAGEVDLFCTVSDRPDLQGEQSAPSAVARVFVHHRAAYGPSMRRLGRWLASGWPRGIAWRDWDDASSALEAFAEPTYDVVWHTPLGAWLALGHEDFGPAVVDYNDLEDEKLRSLRALSRTQSREHRRGRTMRRSLGDVLDAVDVGRWQRLQRRAAEDAAAVVVCSEVERARLGHAEAFVVPNAYEVAEEIAPHTAPPAPVFTMVGLLTYPPNADGALHFAQSILPLVREQVPDAVFRLVGRFDDSIGDVAEFPGVELLGHVDDLDPVFSSTTAVVVPLRAGGGTRIKILEAFARRLPVVSTSLGAEGLEARDREELLVVDEAAAFARACVRLFKDPSLAGALADKGHALWSARYRSGAVRELVRDVAVSVASRSAVQSTPSAGSSSQ